MALAMVVATTMAITMAAVAETGVVMAWGNLGLGQTHILNRNVLTLAKNLT